MFLAAAGLLALAETGQAQEALRLSMANDLSAAEREQTASSIGYYNLLLGTSAWRFSSAMDFEYNDNVRLQENGESDFIVRPGVNTQMHWPVTLQNSLDFSLGAGYSEYLQHADLSQFFINPGSGLSFDIYSGDFKFNLHDQITITEQAYENAGVSGANRDLVSLQNWAGASARWDVGNGLANAGYDHANYISMSQNQGEPDASSENLYVNGGIRVLPELLLGVEEGGSIITYSQDNSAETLVTPDAVQWNSGVFGSAQITEYIDARLDAGYTQYTPGSTANDLVLTDASGLYFAFSLSHRFNRFFTYKLSAGRSTDLSAYGQPQNYYFMRLDPNWTIFEKYTISTPVWWQQGTRVYNTSASVSDYEQIGLGLKVTRCLTQKLSVSVSYQWVDETSNQAALAYLENIVGLNLTYQF